MAERPPDSVAGDTGTAPTSGVAKTAQPVEKVAKDLGGAHWGHRQACPRAQTLAKSVLVATADTACRDRPRLFQQAGPLVRRDERIRRPVRAYGKCFAWAGV